MRYYVVQDKQNEKVILIKRPQFGFICKFVNDELYYVITTDTAHIMKILIFSHKISNQLTEYELIFKYNSELKQIYKKICDDSFDINVYGKNADEIKNTIKNELERLLI